jgi:hypothetical protein
MRRTAGALIAAGWVTVLYLLIPLPNRGDSEGWILWGSGLILTVAGIALGVQILRGLNQPSAMISGLVAFALYVVSRAIADDGFFKMYAQDLLAGRVLDHFGEIASKNAEALLSAVFFNFLLIALLLLAVLMLIVDYVKSRTRTAGS